MSKHLREANGVRQSQRRVGHRVSARAKLEMKLTAMKPLRIAFGLVAAAVAATSPLGAQARSAVEVTDSAGVVIVENHAMAWEPAPPWQVVEEPITTIGSVFGDPSAQFANVQDVAVLSGNRIAIADGQSREIRLFSLGGDYLGTLGGPGEGPGEFERLSSILAWHSGGLIAWDPTQRRLTHFTADGELSGTTRVDWRESSSLYGAEIVDSATIAFLQGLSSNTISPGERVPGRLIRPAAALAIASPEGGDVEPIGRFPGLEIGFYSKGQGTFFGPPPFGRNLSMCAADGLIRLGTRERLEFRVYTPDGVLRRIIRAPTPDLTIDADLRAAYWDAVREAYNLSTPEEEREFRARQETTPFPPTRAAFGSLICEPDGTVWMREYRSTPGNMLPPSWLVFSRRGRWLGRVEMPEGFQLLEVADQYLVGKRRNELDVEFVEVLNLQR